MPQAVDCELLTVDCLIFQHKDTTEIQTVLNKNFRMLFGSKHKIKNSKPLNKQYNDTKIKQRSEVISRVLDETLSRGCLRLATLIKKRPWHRCIPVSFAKFLRTPFLTEQLRWLLLLEGVFLCNFAILQNCFFIVLKTGSDCPKFECSNYRSVSS